MQRRMIGDVLHLIDEAHRTCVAAEQFEGQFGGEPWFVEIRNELRASIHDFLPTLIKRCEVGTRLRCPERPRLFLRR